MEAGQILGPVPDWLPLGPFQTIQGVQVREIIGEWDHLNECDRPPKYLVEGFGVVKSLTEFDRSEDRKPVKVVRPGKSIADLKGRHSGKVAVLFNGSSLLQHDLFQIDCPIIGMNRTHLGWPTYKGPQPDYLCLVDWVWFESPSWRPAVLQHPRIINGSDHHENIGYRVARHSRMQPASFDLERDGYVGPIPATTGHLALQLAVYLGFTEIHCLGWDMGGKHFDGTNASLFFRDAIRYHARQVQAFKDHGVNVYVCGSPESAVQGFNHSEFSAVCEG